MNAARKQPTREEERAKHKDMIAHLMRWPLWPILPLKRPRADATWPDIGFLHGDHASDEDGVKVYLADMYSFSYMTPEQRGEVKTEDFKTVDDLLNAGWIVD